MPPKIRDLIAQLEKAGFRNVGGKGSHRKFVHECYLGHLVVSGNPGADAEKYKIRLVEEAIKEVQHED
jgi:predicted RNA binding protein YcfA (HicA-like mRNA interferase family)